MQGDTIEVLLDKMHIAILCSDFAVLGQLSQPLDDAMTGLTKPDKARLQRISRMAARNAICLQAAARGVRAALHRLTEVRQNASGLVTYDGAGKRSVTAQPGQMARRY